MARSTIQILKHRHEQRKQVRREFDNLFRDIKELVRPNTTSFFNTAPQDSEMGEEKFTEQLDGTAVWANNNLANGLASSLTSSSQRWFGLQIEEVPEPTRDQKSDLDKITERAYHKFALPASCWDTSSHEGYQDVGGFGTAVVFCERSPKTGIIKFKSQPLGDCYIEENSEGEIDALDREIRMTKRQILDRFDEDKIPEKIKNEKVHMTQKYLVVHTVFPRSERDMKRKTKNNKKFASYYYLNDFDYAPLEEGGFDSFPYLVMRWSVIAGETYGRSPAMSCINDIRMLQEMLREIIINAQLTNGPPIVAEDDGFMPDIDFGPRSLIWKEAGTEDPHVIQVTGIPTMLQQLIADTRSHISRCFFVDFLRQEFKKERQTAFEIQDRRDEMFRLMQPMIARIQKEYLAKAIERVILLMDEAGELNDINIDIKKLKIVFQSPATQAQTSIKALEIQRTLADLTPLGQVFPEIFEAFHPKRLANEIIEKRGIPVDVLKTEQELQADQEQKAQQQALDQTIAALPAAAGAAKDIATAQEKGFSLA